MRDRNEGHKIKAEAELHDRLEWARSIAAHHRPTASKITAVRDPRRA